MASAIYIFIASFASSPIVKAGVGEVVLKFMLRS
jgi:hypothetical protein